MAVNELEEGRQISANSTANSTADRAIEILAAFSEGRPIWTAGEIASHFDMPRSTTYRYLNSLRAFGLITDDERGGLRLGPKILALARVAKNSSSIVSAAAPSLRALSERFGEVVSLSERMGHEIVPLERIECSHHVRITFMRGEMLPWPATAAAKALLAFAPQAEAEELFSIFKPHRYTPKTISTVSGLRKELAAVRKQGFAISDQERDEGVRGIAAPIIRGEEARYSVTIGGPAFRIDNGRVREMAKALVEAATAISAELARLDF
jgi:DNA-binding IclR family transcriptional regulator